MNENALFIGGQWCAGMGDRMTSIDPSYGKEIWSGISASQSDVKKAFAAARAAFPAWAYSELEERLEYVTNFAAIAKSRKAELAELIALETGKSLWDAAGEAGVVAAKIDVSIRSYRERTGHKSFETGFGRAELQHRPHGVFAVLGPYNFPAHLPNGQIIPALIAGNTVVCKPSELTPAVGELLVQMYQEAGFPDGVINLVQGARPTGAAILDDDELDGVLFTGSASTGAFIHSKFGGRPEILLALEMGGNNPMIIWDCENADNAASIAVQSAFVTSGQRCTCTRRLIIPDNKQGDEILSAVSGLADKISLGAWDQNKSIGPLVSKDTAVRVVGAADALERLGAKVIRRCHLADMGPSYVSPGIYDVTGLEVPDEEIFGPVLQVIRARNWEHAIEIGNATRFGLAAGLARWEAFRKHIKAGVVNYNRPTTGASGALPFGGPGASGNHNPGAFYAADFCAWPMASQVADQVENLPMQGLK